MNSGPETKTKTKTKTGIFTVDVILQMDLVMMILTWLARAGAVYVILMFLPFAWGNWGKALAIAGLIQIYMVGSVLLYRRKHRIE